MNKPQRVISKYKDSQQTNVLQFPSNVGEIGMVFNFAKYEYKDSGASIRNTNEKSIPGPSIQSSVWLPLPQTIEDKYGIGIGAEKLGALGAVVGDISKLAQEKGNFLEMMYDIGKRGGAALMKESDSLGNSTLDTAYKAIKYFSRSGLDSLLPGLGNAIDITRGDTVNPHKVLSFQGVDLKQFNFSWNFIPESPDESDTIRKIRDTFRYHSLPEFKGITETVIGLSTDRAFLSYPDLVFIELVGVAEGHFFTFKPCMISNISLNYSSQGNVMMRGGRPGAVTMAVSFTETRPHNKADYEPTQ